MIKKRRIIVIDKDENSLGVTGFVLRNARMRVFPAQSVEQAQEILSCNTIDAVLSNVRIAPGKIKNPVILQRGRSMDRVIEILNLASQRNHGPRKDPCYVI
jgi:DNA-binding NtrC family response regulator